MHELGIAQRLIETAMTLLPTGATKVTRIKIQLGALAGVSEDELRFGLEVMSAATPCAGAVVEITPIPAIAHCPQCGLDVVCESMDLLICPTCGTTALIVLQGKELLITSIEITDETIHA